MAPEIVSEESYSKPADVWALGCVLYDICALKPAFHSFDMPGLLVKIKSGKVPLLPKHYSQELRQLARAMLFRDEARRPTALQVLHSPVLTVRYPPGLS
jgi:serine/threonine protein kinase